MKKLNNRSILMITALAGIILGMIFATISFYEGFKSGKNLFSFATSKIKDEPSVLKAIEIQNAFRLVVKTIKPTVVNISIEAKVQSRNPFSDYFGDDFFDHFFGSPQQRERVVKALGSGVIIDKDGYILSNHHVVQNASKIKITLSNGEEYKAKIIGSDSRSDLALLKIDTENDLEAAPLGDSNDLEIGDWAIAIGNPFGLNHTFTIGIISAKGRSGIMGDSSKYENYIQTDAAINKGNSGGPLVNIKGEVIGINAAIYSPSGGSVGLGFAIPVNMARSVFKQLKEKGKVSRGYLGVGIQNLTPDIAPHFNLDPNSGVLIRSVKKRSAAAKGGIENEDIIIEYNGKRIKDSNQLRNLVAETSPGKKVKVIILRNGKKKTLNIIIGELPDDSTEASSITSKDKDKEELWLGLKVDNIKDNHINNLGLDEDEEGVIIIYVKPGSNSQNEGLTQGDIIKKINKNIVKNKKDFYRLIKKFKDNDSFLLLIKRKGEFFYHSIEKEED